MTEFTKAIIKTIGLSLGCVLVVLIAALLNFLIPLALAWGSLGDKDKTPAEEWGIVAGAVLASAGLLIAKAFWVVSL